MKALVWSSTGNKRLHGRLSLARELPTHLCLLHPEMVRKDKRSLHDYPTGIPLQDRKQGSTQVPSSEQEEPHPEQPWTRTRGWEARSRDSSLNPEEFFAAVICQVCPWSRKRTAGRELPGCSLQSAKWTIQFSGDLSVIRSAPVIWAVMPSENCNQGCWRCDRKRWNKGGTSGMNSSTQSWIFVSLFMGQLIAQGMPQDAVVSLPWKSVEASEEFLIAALVAGSLLMGTNLFRLGLPLLTRKFCLKSDTSLVLEEKCTNRPMSLKHR